MDPSRSLLSFIATYASNWTYAYIQDGYAKARLQGVILPDVARNAVSMLEALESSANMYPQGRMAYAISLANAAQLDAGISLKNNSSQVRAAASALGAQAGRMTEKQISDLLGHVEQSLTPTSNISQKQGFNFEGNGGVVVSDNGQSSTPGDKPRGGFWDGFDFNSVSDLLLGLGSVTSSILAGQPYGNSQGANPNNPQGPPFQANTTAQAQSGKFIRTALVVTGVVATVLMGVIVYIRLRK